MSEQTTDQTIRQFQRAVYPAYALLGAIRLDLFTHLSGCSKTVTQLSDLLSLNHDKLQSLLYFLATTGLLNVSEGIFSNSEEAEKFLVKSSRDYIGNEYVAFADRWKRLERTDESVRTGKAAGKIDYSAMTQDELDTFYMGSHRQNQEAARMLMDRFDFTSATSLLDVAGGTGGLGIAIAKAHPAMHSTIIEQNNVLPVTNRFIKDAEAIGKVEAIGCDITLERPDGVYDVAVMKNFIPVISREDAIEAIKNVGKVLSSGGRIFIVDMGTIDDSRLSPLPVVANNLFFLNVFDQGGSRTESERRGWLEQAGFANIHREELTPSLGVMTAEKV